MTVIFSTSTNGMKKILVIDDELSIGELVKDFLDDSGYQTFIATDALTGLEIVKKEKPDLVFLDVLMPRVGGLECLRRIKEISRDTIVVVVSALQDEEIAKQAIRRGAYDYLTKPFDLAYLQDNLLPRIFPS